MPNDEPVALTTAINSAVTATLAILLFVGVNPNAVAAITLGVVGWIAVWGVWARSKVKPMSKIIE